MSDVYTGLKWGAPGYGNAGGQVTWSFAKLAGVLYDFSGVISAVPLQNAIRAAFDLWESVANIDFAEVSDSRLSDIRLGWDSYDGAGGTLAQATWQYSGQTTLYSEIGFDTGDTWKQATASGTYGNDFFAVAVHEIGHAIGLAHVDDHGSIMYPYLGSQTGLSAADVAAIQKLYGPADGAEPQSQDDFVGGPGNDVFTASIGADSVKGGAGDDTLSGGFGNDYVLGEDGHDLLFGNQGTDNVSGGYGNDTVFGGQHNDTLVGEFGNDALYGNLADDLLFGNQGADFLHGGQGNDTLYGGQDSDTLNGGAENDFLSGGLGSDTFVFAPGQGSDVVSDFDFGQGDRLDLQGQSYALQTATDGSVALFLHSGGTITLQGVTEAEFSAGIIA